MKSFLISFGYRSQDGTSGFGQQVIKMDDFPSEKDLQTIQEIVAEQTKDNIGIVVSVAIINIIPLRMEEKSYNESKT